MNVKIHRSAKRMHGNLNSVQELCYPVPLELKTGKMFSKLGIALSFVNRLYFINKYQSFPG